MRQPLTQRESNQFLRRELHRIYPGAAIRVSGDPMTKVKWVDGITPDQMLLSISHLRGLQYSKSRWPPLFPEMARFYTKGFIKTALEGFLVASSADPYREESGFWWVRFSPNIAPGVDEYFSVLFFRHINQVAGGFGKWPSIHAIKK